MHGRFPTRPQVRSAAATLGALRAAAQAAAPQADARALAMLAHAAAALTAERSEVAACARHSCHCCQAGLESIRSRTYA